MLDAEEAVKSLCCNFRKPIYANITRDNFITQPVETYI